MELDAIILSTVDPTAANYSSTVLSFTDKSISDICPDTFARHKLLLKIYFAGNKITSLPEELFVHNTRLREIGLDFNQLTTLPRDIFRSLPDLQVVHLNCNMLPELDKDTFRYNRRLERIYLQYNYVKAFHPATFSHLPELLELRIDVNSLNGFDFSSLASSRKLRSLDIAGNNLTEIESYQKFKTWFPKLQAIDIRNNNFCCSYLREMICFFDDHGINVFGLDKRAGVTANSVFGVSCIPDSQSLLKQMANLKTEFKQMLSDEKMTLKAENISAMNRELTSMKQEIVNIRVDENVKMKIELDQLKKELLAINAAWESKFHKLKRDHDVQLKTALDVNQAEWQKLLDKVVEINEQLGDDLRSFKREIHKVMSIVGDHDDEMHSSRSELKSLRSQFDYMQRKAQTDSSKCLQMLEYTSKNSVKIRTPVTGIPIYNRELSDQSDRIAPCHNIFYLSSSASKIVE